MPLKYYYYSAIVFMINAVRMTGLFREKYYHPEIKQAEIYADYISSLIEK